MNVIVLLHVGVQPFKLNQAPHIILAFSSQNIRINSEIHTFLIPHVIPHIIYVTGAHL